MSARLVLHLEPLLGSKERKFIRYYLSSKVIPLILMFWLLSSTVSGQAWRYLGLSNQTISAIAVDSSNPSVIYAGSLSDFSGGITGAIFRSTNAGATWDTLVRGVTVTRLLIDPHRPATLYASLGINYLTQPGILKSTDGGTTWMESDSGVAITADSGPYAMSLDEAHPETLYVGTSGIDGGSLYRSSNGGQSWTRSSDTVLLASGIISIGLSPIEDNVIFVGSNYTGKVYLSTDMGGHWAYAGLQPSGLIGGIEFSRTVNKVNLACGWYKAAPPGYYSSTDGGATWQNDASGLPDSTDFMAIKTAIVGSEDLVLLAGNRHQKYFGRVYGRKGNAEWKIIGSDTSRVNTIEVCGSTIYAGREGVYAFEIVNSIRGQDQSPVSYLFLRNYPNPFNGGTFIQFDLLQSGYVKLALYDAVGRLVTKLIEEKLSAGSHAVHWDASSSPSGTYFCRLELGGRTTSLKILIVR